MSYIIFYKIFVKIYTLNLEGFKNKLSIIDTDSSYIYIGHIIGDDKECIVMQNADIHDIKMGSSTKEQYVIMVKKIGIKPNRKKVHILKDKIISISLIEDVIEY